jgi:CRP/FNR family transcriptional regulator
MPGLQQQLFRLLSKELGMTSLLAGDHAAEERVAAFVTDLGERLAAQGFSGTRLRLSMSRVDIANYLRLAAETVSRIFTRLRDQGLIALEGRDLEILDPPGLHALARNVRER